LPVIEPGQDSGESPRTTSRPSLLSSNDSDIAAPAALQPMRLLSALEPSSPRRRTSATSSAMKGLIALATLSIAGVAALIVATNSDSTGAPDVVAMGTAPPSTTTPAPSAGAASAPMESDRTPAAAAPVQPAQSPSEEPLPNSRLDGPARVETGTVGLTVPGMAAVAEPVATQRAAASTPVARSALASGLPPHRTKGRSAVAVKSAAAGPARAGHETAADAPARDPDAELVAAIMARLESPSSANGGSTTAATADKPGTIATLVRDCNAMADGASALACRRRICDGYWGKAQACPKSMAPAGPSAGTASAH
jgi:hypothetical protein